MSKLIIMRGLPGSGKSTKAAEILKADGNCVRLNKDLLREMLHFGKFTGKNEGEVQLVQKVLTWAFFYQKKNVIIDDTNLNPKTLAMWREFGVEYAHRTELVDLTDVPLSLCVGRDMGRLNQVGFDVIINMARKAKIYKRERKDVICDIDGTLCDISHRLHFVKGEKKDWNSFFAEIDKDAPRINIIDTVKELSKEFTIVLVTGRPERLKRETMRWLNRFNIPYETLIMRKDRDTRADDIIKQEILDSYFDKDMIELVIDDRPRVIRMWQANGLKVEDVGSGVEF